MDRVRESFRPLMGSGLERKLSTAHRVEVNIEHMEIRNEESANRAAKKYSESIE